MSIEPCRELAALLLVSAAALNDLATRRIPNRLLLVGLGCAAGVVLAAPEPGPALLTALGGLAAGLALLLPFYLLRGMAAGDVKLMAVIGTLLGFDDVLQIVVFTWCVGGVMAVGFAVWHGRVRMVAANLGHILLGARMGAGEAGPERASAGAIPYGVAIAIGTIATLAGHYG